MITVQFYDVLKWSSTLGSYTVFGHYITSLSSLWRLIWRYWTTRMFVSSQLYFMQYMGLCVFSLPFYLMVIVRIPVLDLIIIIKSDVWPICHCLGLGNETIALNNRMSCYIPILLSCMAHNNSGIIFGWMNYVTLVIAIKFINPYAMNWRVTKWLLRDWNPR